jgi:hypothetical protein
VLEEVRSKKLLNADENKAAPTQTSDADAHNLATTGPIFSQPTAKDEIEAYDTRWTPVSKRAKIVCHILHFALCDLLLFTFVWHLNCP